MVNVDPIWRAIGTLTGIDPWDVARLANGREPPGRDGETWKAIVTVTNAITFLVAPDKRHAAWLQKVPRLWTEGQNERRSKVMGLLRARLSYPTVAVHSALTNGLGFAGLTEERCEQALKFLKAERNVSSVAARLSLACGGFGDRQRRGESLERAIQRVATTYREAERDADTLD